MKVLLFAALAVSAVSVSAAADTYPSECNYIVRKAALDQAKIDFPSGNPFIYYNTSVRHDPQSPANVLTQTVMGSAFDDDVDSIGDYDVTVSISGDTCVAVSTKLRPGSL